MQYPTNIEILQERCTKYQNRFILYHESFMSLEVERTSKNRTSNIPNLRGSNFEHIRTSHLGPKPNFEPLEHHQKPNCSRTLLIKNGPNFFQNHQNQNSNMSEHVILAKTELRTSTSPNTKQFPNIELFVPRVIYIQITFKLWYTGINIVIWFYFKSR